MTLRPARAACSAVVAAWLGLAPLAATAQSFDWTFEVVEVSRENDAYQLLRLRPLPPGRSFPRSCEMLVVHSTFDLGEWSTGSRMALSAEGHERALQKLRQAQTTGAVVRFGVIGRGFAPIEQSPRCEVASRALVYVLDEGGSGVVYSLFADPEG